MLRLALFLERSDATHVHQSVVAASWVSVPRDLSARGPVLLAVDDVRSLDPPTAVVLYSRGRMRAQAVGLLLAGPNRARPCRRRWTVAEGVRRLMGRTRSAWTPGDGATFRFPDAARYRAPGHLLHAWNEAEDSPNS